MKKRLAKLCDMFRRNSGNEAKMIVAVISLVLGAVLVFLVLDLTLEGKVIPWQALQCPQVFFVMALAAMLLLCFAAYARITYNRDVLRGFDACGVVLPYENPVGSYDEGSYLEAMEVLTEQCELEDSEALTGIPYSDRVPTDVALASVFVTACLTPRELYTCIDERVRSDSRSLRVESNVTFKIPYIFKDSPFVIPAFFHRRGAYPDSLDILESTEVTSFLNLTESNAYVKRVLQTTLHGIEDEKELWGLIREYVTDRSPMTEESVAKRRDDLMEISEGLKNWAVKKDGTCEKHPYMDLTNLAIRLLGRFIEAYPICVRCMASPTDDSNAKNCEGSWLRYLASHSRTTSISFSFRLPLVENPHSFACNQGKIRRFLQRVVRRPNTIYYGLGNASRTQSYHLQAIGPENTFCSEIALRQIAVTGETGSRHPGAEMAYCNRRYGQRHMSMCVKNGRGFSNWMIMYRHSPRYESAYLFSLVVAVVTFAMMWIYLYMTLNLREGSDESVIVAFIVGIATIGISWIARENRGSRGGDSVPSIVIVLIAISTALIFISLVGDLETNRLMQGVLMVDMSLLGAVTLILSARCAVHAFFQRKLRRESEPPMDLIVSDNDGLTEGTGWSPGWMAVDANRFIASRYDEDISKDAGEDYNSNANYVRDTFVSSINAIQEIESKPADDEEQSN